MKPTTKQPRYLLAFYSSPHAGTSAVKTCLLKVAPSKGKKCAKPYQAKSLFALGSH